MIKAAVKKNCHQPMLFGAMEESCQKKNILSAHYGRSPHLNHTPKSRISPSYVFSVKRPQAMPFWNEIVCGDSVELMKQIPGNSVDLVITSPPYYQQRQYDGGGIGNEKNVDGYVSSLMTVFRECVRIIKPSGSIIFNVGDKYKESSLQLVPYRFAIAATEQCDIKLVNHITWVKSNPTPRQFKRRLVSSTEPFFHFVKSLDYQYHLDEFLKPQKNSKPASNGNGENVGKTYYALIEQSELTDRQKQHAIDELEKVIQEVRTGTLQSFRMKIRGIHSEPFGGQEGGRKIQLEKNGFTIIRIFGNPLKRDVITTPVETIKNCPHPAIYPVQIIDEMLSLLTSPGDVVVDPFMGSGSTAVSALRNQRIYIGFDISEEYCRFARDRIKGEYL